MPRIFISYRRADSQNITERIHEHLSLVFGKDNVFQDVMSISYGADFRRVLEEQVNACDVLLVIIGQEWANVREVDEETGKETSRLRLFNEEDFVRIEVETGLRNPNTLVIPVLVNDAGLPRASELPESLQDLRKRNAATVRNNPFFENDVKLLVRHLRRPRYTLIAGGIAAVMVLIASVLLLLTRPNPISEVQQALTKTVEAQIAVIVTQFALQTSVVQTAIATVWTPTPSITSLPSDTFTPTLDQKATASAQAGLDIGSTQIIQEATAARATNIALETQNAPTNTPPPTNTPTSTRTFTPTPTPRPTTTPQPTINRTATAIAQITQTAQAIQAIDNANATLIAQNITATHVAQSKLLTPTVTPIPVLIGLTQSTNGTNVRSEPSTSSRVVETLPPNTLVTILEVVENGAWFHVQLSDGTNGYIGSTVMTQLLPVTHNADWQPIVRNFDGVDMVLVPQGCFDMGENGEGGRQCFSQPFWIDKTEVANAQFEKFKGNAAKVSEYSGGQQARDTISWLEARDFCVLRGARLPTEREWEYAARGPDNLTYPWGNNFIPDNVIYDGNPLADVGSRPSGKSWVGALDMSGSVLEWVSSHFQPYPYRVDDGREKVDTTTGVWVMRGGSWSSLGNSLRTFVRAGAGSSDSIRTAGLRCAHNYDG